MYLTLDGNLILFNDTQHAKASAWIISKPSGKTIFDSILQWQNAALPITLSVEGNTARFSSRHDSHMQPGISVNPSGSTSSSSGHSINVLSTMYLSVLGRFILRRRLLSINIKLSSIDLTPSGIVYSSQQKHSLSIWISAVLLSLYVTPHLSVHIICCYNCWMKKFLSLPIRRRSSSSVSSWSSSAMVFHLDVTDTTLPPLSTYTAINESP